MDAVKRRAWWSHRQGLDGSLAAASAGEVLGRSGWSRSVGGAGPYLTLWARAGIGRAAADSAVASLEIHELPSARGCTYVVPASDFALALRLAQEGGQQDLKTAAKLGVTTKEIESLSAAVVTAVSREPLDPDGIREAVGGAARNLGAEGKKKGMTTTLPLALGRLQSAGEIRRLPVDGRLDQQRYRYTTWLPNPLAKSSMTLQEAHEQLANRYFRWVGPATVKEFAWFSGLGVKASAVAIAPLGLVEVEAGSGLLMHPDDFKTYRSFRVPQKPTYVLTSSLDAIHAHRRELQGLLDPGDADHPLLNARSLGAAGGLIDLPSHAIFDRGRLVGLWEYEPATESIAWASFVGKPRALVEAVEQTQHFVTSQLGDARSFSLDSPKSRAGRIESLRTV